MRHYTLTLEFISGITRTFGVESKSAQSAVNYIRGSITGEYKITQVTRGKNNTICTQWI